MVVLDHGTGQKVCFGQDLEAVANTQHGQLGIRVCRVDDLGHQGSKSGDGACAQVVAIGEAAGDDDGVNIGQGGIGMPKFDGGGAGEAHGADCVSVIEGAGKGHYADAGTRQTGINRSLEGPANQGSFCHG